MKELMRKEMREALCKDRLAYDLMSLAMMAFVMWNFTGALAHFQSQELRLILQLLPSYLVTFLALLLIKNFTLEKRLGILEAVLATGTSKQQLAMARSAQVATVAGVQTLLLLAFAEAMLRAKLRTSLLAYWTGPADWLTVLVMLVFSLAAIWLMVTLVLCRSQLADFTLVVAFALTFLYAGFYYQLRHLPVLGNVAVCLAISGVLASMAWTLLRSVPSDRIIMD